MLKRAMLFCVVSIGLTACDTDASPVLPTAHLPAARQAPPAAPAGPSINGTVRSFSTGEAVEKSLCVSLYDPSTILPEGAPTLLTSTTTDSRGTFQLSGLPTPHTLGWVLVVDDCGDTTTYLPTGTPLPGEWVGGRAASDTLTVDASLVPTSTRDQIDAGLRESRSGSFLGDDGGMIGHVVDTDGTRLHESWVRGPNATQLWYARPDGSFVLYENTHEDADSLWVAPDAEDVYGVFVTRVAGKQFRAETLGGFPGVILVWDWVTWSPGVENIP